ncbi:MAG TPA: hypothetical protein VMJ32_15920 [Pirellulales bacterium]|nr:hypothetical protein [Pirellulales bacterium]
MDDEAFLRQFEDCTWPLEQFHHREHVKIAYLYLRRFSFDEALHRMCVGLKRYNATHQVPDALDRGYHETLTQAWMRLVYFTLCEYGPVNTADEFVDQHPQLWQMKVLRLFYSRDRLISREAKQTYLPPDITKLPESKPSLKPE